MAGWGTHLDQNLVQVFGRLGKRLHINVLELKGLSYQIKKFQTSVLKSDGVAIVVAYINKQGGTHSVCSPMGNHDKVPSLQNIMTCQTRHSPGCLNVMAISLSRWMQIHKVPLYVSQVADQKAWKIDVLNINCSGLVCLPSYGSTSQDDPENPPVQVSHNPGSSKAPYLSKL